MPPRTLAHERTWWWTALLALLALTLAAPMVRAQDEDEEEEEEVVADAAMLGMVNVFDMNEAQVNAWMFGDSQTPAAARKKLESQLTMRLEGLSRVCELTEAQEAKLHLAAEGDLKRFFDRVEALRAKHLNKRYDQNQFQEVYQQFQEVQKDYRQGDLFDEGSIFHKAVRHTLDSSQTDAYESVLRERRQFQYRAKVELQVALISRSVGLTAGQSEKFIELIMAETRPPRAFGQNDYYGILYQVAHLPREEVKAIFDDAQWGVLEPQLRQAKGLKQFLESNGFIPDEDEEKPEDAEKAEDEAALGVRPGPAGVFLRILGD